MEDFNKVLLLTSVCCMACDGEIAKEEISTLKKLSSELKLFDKEELNNVLPVVIESLTKYGYEFVKSYLDLLDKSVFSNLQALKILEVATKTIYADDKTEYDEIKFFKAIRKRLRISDEEIISKIEGVEEYWLNDDAQDNNISSLEANFGNFDFSSLKLD